MLSSHIHTQNSIHFSSHFLLAFLLFYIIYLVTLQFAVHLDFFASLSLSLFLRAVKRFHIVFVAEYRRKFYKFFLQPALSSFTSVTFLFDSFLPVPLYFNFFLFFFASIFHDQVYYYFYYSIHNTKETI